MIQCEVSHIDDPAHFYCQPITTQAALHELMDRMDEYCLLAPPCGGKLQQMLGLPVIAKYSEDDAWYRAQITGQ